MKQVLLLLIIVFASLTTIEAQTITWTGDGDGTNWSDSSNWDLLQIPTTSNDVIVPDGSTLTVNTWASAKSLVVEGASVISIEDNLSMSSPSTFGENTVINWYYGSLGGSGSLTNYGTININRPEPSFSSPGIVGPNFSFNNEGVINLINGHFAIQWNAILNNQISGIIDLGQVEYGITRGLDSYGILNNYGVIRKTQGNGVTQNSVVVNNYGIIEAMSGVLKFDYSDLYTYTNLYNSSSGVVKGTHTLEVGETNFSNAGTFEPGASPGTLTVIGDFTSSVSSKLAVELNGLIQDIEHDLLAIEGDAIFKGKVDVTLGFEGSVNDEFIIATTTGTITICEIEPTTSAVYDGKYYDFSVTCRNNNEIVLTLTNVTLGIEDFEFTEKSIRLFPNPTNNSITLQNNSRFKLLSAIIYDFSGRKIETIDLKDMGEDRIIVLNNYSSGIYFIHINSEYKSIAKRVIKR